jgi:membrane fusion protein (multidrug efflux system)
LTLCSLFRAVLNRHWTMRSETGYRSALVVAVLLVAGAARADSLDDERPAVDSPVTGANKTIQNNDITDGEGRGGEYLDCLLEPHMVVNVSSASAGVIDEILVDRGDRVEADDVVVRLQSDVEKRAVDLARAKSELADKKQKRSAELYKERFISQHEKDELGTQSLVARLELKQATEMLERRTIRSPIKGVVVERFLSPGEFVEADKILKIAQIDPLNVEVVLPVAMVGEIHKGGSALVYPEVPRGAQFKATVTVMDSVVDAASGTMGVRLELPNPGYEIPAGLKCKVRFVEN